MKKKAGTDLNNINTLSEVFLEYKTKVSLSVSL